MSAALRAVLEGGARGGRVGVAVAPVAVAVVAGVAIAAVALRANERVPRAVGAVADAGSAVVIAPVRAVVSAPESVPVAPDAAVASAPVVSAMTGAPVRQARVTRAMARRVTVPVAAPGVMAQPVVAGAAVPAVAMGVLRVLVFPWGHVFVDGHGYGRAPQDVSLTLGMHDLRVTGAIDGRRQVMIRENHTTVETFGEVDP
jgi:hypothetical protein